MTFKVDPEALVGYAAQVGRAKEDAVECQKYFATNAGDISFSEGGIINPLYYEHGAVKEKVNGMLTHLADLLEKSKTELATAAQQYRTTDASAAAKVDESYPTVARPVARRD